MSRLRITFPRLWANLGLRVAAPRRRRLQILGMRGFSGKDRTRHLRQVGCSRFLALMDLSLDGFVRQTRLFGQPPVRQAVCSALTNSFAKTGRQISAALSRIRQGASPERLLHVEQFCHFARFCASVLFFRKGRAQPRTGNREPATANQRPRDFSRKTCQIGYGFRT
jgi:hypothetical protein